MRTDLRTDDQTDVKRLMIDFRNMAKAFNKIKNLSILYSYTLLFYLFILHQAFQSSIIPGWIKAYLRGAEMLHVTRTVKKVKCVTNYYSHKASLSNHL